jgi:hypothetical protein
MGFKRPISIHMVKSKVQSGLQEMRTQIEQCVAQHGLGETRTKSRRCM